MTWSQRRAVFPLPTASRRHRISRSSTEISVRQRRPPKVAQDSDSAEKFGSIDHVVNNAGISSRPSHFTDYTIGRSFAASWRFHQPGRVHLHDASLRSGRCSCRVTWWERDKLLHGVAGLDNPDRRVFRRLIPMMTKGADSNDDYAEPRERIREGSHPLQRGGARVSSRRLSIRRIRKISWKTLSPMGTISSSKDIADAVIYLAEAQSR